MKQAEYFQKLDNNKVKCVLCPNNCVISDGNYGNCKIRHNIKGILYTDVYEKLCAVHVDPIEKKPLYHYYPNSNILSIGTVGCNLHCTFCQNYDISQVGINDVTSKFVTCEDLSDIIKENNSFGVAYTYNEPLINYEYVYECASFLQKLGYKNVLVTNGYINPEPLKELVQYIDAANIDFKASNNEFYKKICGGNVDSIKKSIEIMYENNVFIELTNLLIPGQNDSDEAILDLVKWISNIDRKIPLHFSRYFPSYKMQIEPTSKQRLLNAYNIASKYLDYVYLGNISLDTGQDTICPKCKEVVIERSGYNTKVIGLEGSKCKFCNEKLNIIV